MVLSIPNGVAHNVPADLRKALKAAPDSLAAWRDITPLARNEWLCWIVSVKSPETRQLHIDRTISELAEGQRRPCCWMGCIHRTDKAASKSQAWAWGKK